MFILIYSFWFLYIIIVVEFSTILLVYIYISLAHYLYVCLCVLWVLFSLGWSQIHTPSLIILICKCEDTFRYKIIFLSSVWVNRDINANIWCRRKPHLYLRLTVACYELWWQWYGEAWASYVSNFSLLYILLLPHNLLAN